MMKPIPASVYHAAVHAYTLTSADLFAADEAALAWAVRRWPGVDFSIMRPATVALWIVSMAAQDGHE